MWIWRDQKLHKSGKSGERCHGTIRGFSSIACSSSRKKMSFLLKPKDFVKTIFEQEFALIIQSSICFLLDWISRVAKVFLGRVGAIFDKIEPDYRLLNRWIQLIFLEDYYYLFQIFYPTAPNLPTATEDNNPPNTVKSITCSARN